MKRAITTMTLIGAVALGSVAAATGAERADEVYCHGQVATYVATAGDDDLSDRDGDFGRNPVIVLGEGSDELKLGDGYNDQLDSLTVCAGSGDDVIDVGERIGDHSRTLLDGGEGDDFVGNDGGLTRSDLAKMELIGGGGDDTLRGGNGNDDMAAGRGDDTLYGVGGIDEMSGGTGNDNLQGQRGSDRLIGGSGFDFLDGDMPGYPDGTDTAIGGANRDECEAEVKRSCEI